MRKIKLAFWGITNDIWKSIKAKIDPRKADILFFLDNNQEMQGKTFESKPIYVSREKILKKIYDVDYILIAAYSGFQKIEQQLLEEGYPQNKIQLYITQNLQLYNLGNLHNIDEELINAIYFEPRKRLNEVREYQRVYEEYMKMDSFGENTGRWYENGPLISHACGGFVNGKKIKYSNSKEALKDSFSKQFRLIECDVLGIEQNEIILAHEFERFYESLQEGYTLQTISDMLIELKKTDVSMLIDVKWSNIKEYSWYISQIMKTVNAISVNEKESERLKKQIVMEVYDEESIQCAYENGFDMFFTQYRNENINNFMKTAVLCKKYNIGAVGFPIENMERYKRAISIFKNKNIKIYVFSCDLLEEYNELRKMGVDGIFTNYLSYQDI